MTAGAGASVLDFGADPTGTDDSTAEIQAACDSLPFGGEVAVPRGSYKILGTVTLPDGVCLRGHGRYASVLLAAHGSLDVLVLGADCHVSHIGITATVTRTGGAFVRAPENGPTVRDFAMTGYYLGIKVEGLLASPVTAPVVRDGIMRAGVAAVGSGAVSIIHFASALVSGMTITGPASGPQPDFSVRLGNGDTAMLSDTNATRHGSMLAAPDAAHNLFALHATGCVFDSAGISSAGADQWAGIVGGAGNVHHTRIVNCWFGLSENGGLLIQGFGAGVVDGLQLVGCELSRNVGPGLRVAAGASNWAMSGGLVAGNGDSGIILSDTEDWQVVGARIGAAAGAVGNQWGIEISGTCDHFQVVHVNTRDNIVGTINDTSSGADKILADNI
jgi:hypothetical protein